MIGPIAIACFDPEDKSYRTLRAGPFEFSASGSATRLPLVEATGLKVLGTDINYIKPDAPAQICSCTTGPKSGFASCGATICWCRFPAVAAAGCGRTRSSASIRDRRRSGGRPATRWTTHQRPEPRQSQRATTTPTSSP